MLPLLITNLHKYRHHEWVDKMEEGCSLIISFKGNKYFPETPISFTFSPVDQVWVAWLFLKLSQAGRRRPPLLLNSMLRQEGLGITGLYSHHQTPWEVWPCVEGELLNKVGNTLARQKCWRAGLTGGVGDQSQRLVVLEDNVIHIVKPDDQPLSLPGKPDTTALHGWGENANQACPALCSILQATCPELVNTFFMWTVSIAAFLNYIVLPLKNLSP